MSNRLFPLYPQTVVSCSPEKFAQEVIHNCKNCPSWNKTIKKCQIHEVSNFTLVLFYKETVGEDGVNWPVGLSGRPHLCGN